MMPPYPDWAQFPESEAWILVHDTGPFRRGGEAVLRVEGAEYTLKRATSRNSSGVLQDVWQRPNNGLYRTMYKQKRLGEF